MLNISRVAVLPEVKEANTIYMVPDGDAGLSVVVTGSTGAVIKSTKSAAEITAEIAAAASAASGTAASDLAAAVAALEGLVSDEETARIAGDAATLASAGGLVTAEAGLRVDGDAATLASANGYADNAATVAAAAAQAAAQTFATGAANTAQSNAQTYADGLVASLDMSNTAIYAADITARDALVMTKSSFVMVADASADATVTTGAALYFFNVDADPGLEFTKVAEYESMDLTIPNIDILADLGDTGGLLTYKGTLVATVQHTGSEW